ncbi:phage tail-like protein [Pedobacter cryoconitis]|uniref:Phage tail-like protein n=1 Tax=Pedobacter cryoconitis TaxID=188932 RepID=A0A7W8ZMR3_9SPHI|nr:phage tail protein [Pedobacter cryoconitis]MBB5636867.1 phage tail-like protein [Pedobacter cryoconitis]
MAYPYEVPVAFSFEVRIPGFSNEGECSFRDVGGLSVKMDLETVIEGGVNDYEHKLPKRAQYNPLVLKRGILRGSQFTAWINDAIRNFNFKPKQIYISLIDEQRAPTIRWRVENAYPVGIEMSEFKAEENALAIETLTIAYDYFVRME